MRSAKGRLTSARAVQIVVIEQAAKGRLRAEDPKKIGVDEESAGKLRAVAKLDAHFAAEVAAQRFERLAVAANVDKITAGESRRLAAGLFRIGGNELRFVLHRDNGAAKAERH